ncbi:HPF/RaiA family ribosome-associated protein [Vibrio barjaei]|uniref:HPF/RaiA family ribosome-associated protein n=1 Tax=Vibrio barjaei TaxID=1676683 RepID=UPI002283A13C|nr:HPF/RaiA family ribosome-associated protein [Vibrio barjaei]MCY9870423.1 HPF/RaiA family ribosome-associated protein [Vibrio barjaei]
MNIRMNTRGAQECESIAQLATDKSKRQLGRLGIDGVEFLLEVTDKYQVLSATIVLPNVGKIHASSSGENAYQLIDPVIAKLRKQAVRHKRDAGKESN